MEFPSVGPAERAVVLVMALVLVGPERLPKLAADIARTMGGDPEVQAIARRRDG